MRGIEENADLFEVQSGFFGSIELSEDDHDDKILIDKVLKLAEHPCKIDEPWLKSLIVSVLDILLEKTFSAEDKSKYRKLQYNLIWNSTIEDDPILLFLRAKDYREQKKYTHQIRYLKQIIEKHPEFVYAKKDMVRACWKIAGQDKERSERVFARDVADEFLQKFDIYLSSNEKIEFQKILSATTSEKQTDE